MPVAVAGQLVAAGDDAADQRRVALGDPAEGEERGVHAGAGELLQQPVGVGLDAARQRLPAGAGITSANAWTWK